MAYFVAHSHVRLTNIMFVAQISSLGTVHECYAVETFHSIGCGPSSKGHIVLRDLSHFVQQFFERISLGFTCEPIL